MARNRELAGGQPRWDDATTMRALLASAVTLLVACRPGPTAAAERRLTIFYTAEIHGVLEPCGCTSDPLGDVARYGTVVAEARHEPGGVLLVDAGAMSYPEGGLPARELEA